MPTDILYQTFATMWPLLLAIVVWMLANQTSDESDALKHSISVTTRRARSTANGDNRHSRSGRPNYNRRELRTEPRSSGGGHLRRHLRLRRPQHFRSASIANTRSSKNLPSA